MKPRPLAPLRGLLCAAAVITAIGLFAASPAQAHNTLVRSNPADGATVAKPPSTVTLTFNQKVLSLGTSVRVTGPDGDVQVGEPELDDGQVRQRVSADAPAGDYTVAWRATSVDGHPITGDFEFTATKGAATRPATASATPTPSPSATSVADSDDDGDEINWPAVIGWGAAGALIGFGYVVFQRRRRSGNGS